MRIEPKTLKGFRDFLPKESRKRQYVIDTFKKVFESFGFEPLETPALEYQEILLGKYGDEGDKLMYKFKDNGERNVALRYDQTVPTSRVVAQYQNELPMPFKRYQIQPVWRAENTQKGRFREFLQCDADIIGTNSLFADAEIIATAATALTRLGFPSFKIFINDRKIFSTLIEKGLITSEQLPSVLRVIDKLDKIGRDSVLEELGKLGFDTTKCQQILESLENQTLPEDFTILFEFLTMLNIPNTQYEFKPTLARGLDYYTSTIFEIEISGYTAGSVCGGGRYDELIGMFAGRQIPAVGFAFGFDRIMEALEELNLFPEDLTTTQILVTVFSLELSVKSIEIATMLRINGVNTELYLDSNAKMEKQLKYADQKGIPYVVVIGPDEAQKEIVTLKNMKTGDQAQVTPDQILAKITNW